MASFPWAQADAIAIPSLAIAEPHLTSSDITHEFIPHNKKF